MNEIIDFAIAVILISSSGVMAPGPLFVANIANGVKEGTKAGVKIAVGHSIIELPLVIMIGIGVISLEVFPEYRTAISIFGALSLFIFAGIQIRAILKKEAPFLHQKHGSIITGITLSALNPFFIVWWLSVGFKLISDAILIWAFAGTIILFLFHIWMDFAWLGAVAFLAKKSTKIISNRNYKIMMLCLSTILVYYGVIFLIEV